jgi:HEAT repeat protein
MRHRLIHSVAFGVALALGSGASAQAPAAGKAARAEPPAAGAKAEAKAGAAAKGEPAKPAAKRAKKDPAASAKNKAAIESARGMMASNRRENVEAGIQSLGLLGTAEAVEPIAERIRQGLPSDLLETAIVTLMALGQPNAGPVLYELTAHRRADVRLRAVEAIAAARPSGAERALLAALSDSDTRVRSAAAVGLGELGASSAIEKLFLALDRGNMEASGAIGKVVAPGEAQRLTDYLGQVPLRNLGPALSEVLRRKDVAERAKLDIIARLEEVGTKEVKGYIGDLIAAGGDSLTPSISKALLRAMQEIPD